ncbi:MAG: glycosyltransferase [Halorhodospira sp.]
MKVLYAAAYAAGSIRARMLNVVRTGESFAAVADEAVLLTRRGPVRDRATLNEQYGVGSGFRWIQVPGWMERSVFPPLVLPWILRERPDVVVARHWTLPLWTARLGIPSILEVHDPRGARPPLVQRYLRALSRGATFCGLVAKSDAHRQAYLDAGLPADRVRPHLGHLDDEVLDAVGLTHWPSVLKPPKR